MSLNSSYSKCYKILIMIRTSSKQVWNTNFKKIGEQICTLPLPLKNNQGFLGHGPFGTCLDQSVASLEKVIRSFLGFFSRQTLHFYKFKTTSIIAFKSNDKTSETFSTENWWPKQIFKILFQMKVWMGGGVTQLMVDVSIYSIRWKPASIRLDINM